jgi:hypothetical protein
MRALRAVLRDLPRHALRLLRRVEKRARRALCSVRPSQCAASNRSVLLDDWRLPASRIERPPDKSVPRFHRIHRFAEVLL